MIKNTTQRVDILKVVRKIMTIADSITKEFEGVHSNQLIGEDNPGTLDQHPLFFVWERIHTIEQQFPLSDLENHFLVDYLTKYPTSPHTSYQDLFAEWEADIMNQRQSHDANNQYFSAYIGPLNGLVNFLFQVDECMWISKLDEALRGDTTFKALIIWLLSQGPEQHPIFWTIHNTRDPETDITYFSYGEDEFFARKHYDATVCEEETDETTIDQLPIPSSIREVEKDGDNQAFQLFKYSNHGQLVSICSDRNEINDLHSQGKIDSERAHFIQVPEKTHIPLCIHHFSRACMIISDLQQADINRFHRFLSAGGHPGMLSYNSGTSGGRTSNQEQLERNAPEGFSKGYGIQQDSQGQDVFIIFLRINQLFESFKERLPAALDKYKSEHNGLPIGIVAYGPGMWEIFSHFLFVGCEDKGVIANVDCLLHFTDAGQRKTEASPFTPTGGRGWNIEDSDFSDARGYWTE